MKRTIAVLASYFLIGLVLNIVVSVACAYFVRPNTSEPLFSYRALDNGHYDMTTVYRGFGQTRINRAKMDWISLDDEGDIKWMDWSHSGDEYCELQGGWPLRSLKCRNYSEVEINTGSFASAISKSGVRPVVGGIVFDSSPTATIGPLWRAIPYQPIWLGLTVNTLLYSLTIWALLAGPFKIRNALRRRRGLCVSCAYPIGNSPICTECGGPVRN